MKKKAEKTRLPAAVLLTVLLTACQSQASQPQSAEARNAGVMEEADRGDGTDTVAGAYTADTAISQVISDPVFGDYGRLIFPVNKGYYSGDTLGELRLTWYSHIDREKTVEIANYFRERAAAGETIFYDIYTDEDSGVKRHIN